MWQIMVGTHIFEKYIMLQWSEFQGNNLKFFFFFCGAGIELAVFKHETL